MMPRSWVAASAVTSSLLAALACSSGTPAPSPVTSSEVVIATASASASSVWAPLAPASSTGVGRRGEGPLQVVSEQIVLPTPLVFHVGKATLREEESGELLDALAATILHDPSMTRVRVESHSDSQGDARMNLELTVARAQAVVQALVQRGVNPGRLNGVGLGGTRPIADNDTAGGRAHNRRVEVYVEQRGMFPRVVR